MGKGEAEELVSEWGSMRWLDWPLLALEMAGDHEPRNASSFKKLKKASKWKHPSSIQKEINPANTSVLVQGDPFQTFDTKNCDITNLCCFKLPNLLSLVTAANKHRHIILSCCFTFVLGNILCFKGIFTPENFIQCELTIMKTNLLMTYLTVVFYILTTKAWDME